jgi:predicted RNase H-like nuclease (RuvC/YqgF family)
MLHHWSLPSIPHEHIMQIIVDCLQVERQRKQEMNIRDKNRQRMKELAGRLKDNEVQVERLNEQLRRLKKQQRELEDDGRVNELANQCENMQTS